MCIIQCLIYCKIYANLADIFFALNGKMQAWCETDTDFYRSTRVLDIWLIYDLTSSSRIQQSIL